jgi:hypothetical protein
MGVPRVNSFTRFAWALILSLVATAVLAQPPATKSVPESELDRIAIDVLKEMHNKGAVLYNAGDTAGSLKVYNTTLLSVKPFLKHRPAIQKAIETGLTEVEKSDTVKLQAYRLHELIERIRADLKPAKKRPPLTGVLKLDGQPLAKATITIAGKGRAFTTVCDAEGKYSYTDELPYGEYTVIVTGPQVPAKFNLSETSGLLLEIAPGPENTRDLELKSK